MLKKGWNTLSFVLALSLVAASRATKVVVFGDSLSDIGNTFREFQAPPFPFFEGRWTNGPAWPDYLAREGNLTLLCYAYGGAASGGTAPDASSVWLTNVTSQGTPPPWDYVPDVREQVASYLSSERNGSTEDFNCTMFIIAIGGNDLIYLAELDTAPLNVLDQLNWISGNITAQAYALAKAGARNILVSTLPNPALVPELSSYSASDLTDINSAVSIVNEGILAGLAEVPSLCNCSVNISTFDASASQAQGIANYTALGYNTTAGCYFATNFPAYTPYTLCPNPEDYFYWDTEHTVTNVHALLASELLGVLRLEFPGAFGETCASKVGFSATAVPATRSFSLNTTIAAYN